MTLFVAKLASEQDRSLFDVRSFVPTNYFGDGSMTTHANAFFIKTAIPHTWRRNAGLVAHVRVLLYRDETA